MVYNYTVPRRPIMAMYAGPGPCYGLPGLTGQTQHDPRSVHIKKPAYSFGSRTGLGAKDCSPGPCYYPNPKIFRDGMDGTPHYSLYDRRPPLEPFNVPGPGTYRPEGCDNTVYHKNPLYSFSDRTKLRRLDNVPAPNRYTLPSMLCTTVDSRKKQPPIYSMRRTLAVGGFADDLAKAPGPGTYNEVESNMYKNKLPQWSCALRFKYPEERCPKPGPGAHRPENVTINKYQYPSHSFGIHHSQYLYPLIAEPAFE